MQPLSLGLAPEPEAPARVGPAPNLQAPAVVVHGQCFQMQRSESRPEENPQVMSTRKLFAISSTGCVDDEAAYERGDLRSH